MLNLLNLLKRLFIVLVLVVGALVTVASLGIYSYQDRIVAMILAKLNEQQDYDIQVRDIRPTFLESFPHFGVTLREVGVEKSALPQPSVFSVKKMKVSLSTWALLQGRLSVHHVALEQGNLCLSDELLAERSANGTPSKSMLLLQGLRSVVLRGVNLVYASQMKGQLHMEDVRVMPSWREDCLMADCRGSMSVGDVQYGTYSFANRLPLSFEMTVCYSYQDKMVLLQPSSIFYGQSRLALQGSWDREGKVPATLTVRGKHINPQLLLRCWPHGARMPKPHDLRGQLSVQLTAMQKQGHSMTIYGGLGLEKGLIVLDESSQPIACNKLSTILQVPNVHRLATASLKVTSLDVEHMSSRLSGTLAIHDFINPRIRCQHQARLGIDSLSALLPQALLSNASGAVHLGWKLDADWGSLMRGEVAGKDFKLSGGGKVEGLHFKWGSGQTLCQVEEGQLKFKNNVWHCQALTGRFGPGSFQLNGTMSNLLPQLFVKDQQAKFAGNLYVDYLDLDPLLVGENKGVGFYIDPRWHLTLDCDIQQFHLRRFQGNTMRGCVTVDNQKLALDQVQIGIAAGKAYLDGVVDARGELLDIRGKTRCKGVELSKLFYMFENFNQDFLVDQNLSGEMSASIDLKVKADRHWRLCQDTLCTDIDMELKRGILKDFAPIQRLGKYISKDKGLNKMAFSELRNRIKIRKKVIHIPRMEVHSNVTKIKVSGTHSLDGKIHYKLVVPMSSFSQHAIKEIPDEVSSDVLEGINLFLMIQGHVKDYKIFLDTGALQKSVRGGLRKQQKEIGALLQGHYKVKEKTKELSDDYLDLE